MDRQDTRNHKKEKENLLFWVTEEKHVLCGRTRWERDVRRGKRVRQLLRNFNNVSLTRALPARQTNKRYF